MPIFGLDIEENKDMRTLGTAWIIHIFALLHAAVALLCRLSGVEDELLLTILTMAMALVICLKRGLSIEFSAASIIVANIIGYFLGTLGADLLELVIPSPYAVHALSTAATTEILGWSIVALTKIFRRKGGADRLSISAPYLQWILLAMTAVFFLRLGIVLMSSSGFFAGGDLIDATSKVFSNAVALIMLICANLLYIRFLRRAGTSLRPVAKGFLLAGFILTASLLEALLVGVGLPFSISRDFGREFPVLFIASLLAELTVYCLVFMVNYALTARSEMQEERGKANLAQYRYMKLKQQVNPHFLFNSLNILDCLVCEEKTEQASTYIHKLAGIYRYMLKSEDEDVVPLRDELVFTELYIDLLKVRFPEGFTVETDIPEELMARFVLPCSLQLLIENATKHNVVSPECPLTIRIQASDGAVHVCNNLQPKVTQSQSTGLGLKYMRQQYLDLSGKSISVEQTDGHYCVTLPLL